MSSLQITPELQENMLGLMKAFGGENPITKVDGQYYLRFDRITVSHEGVVFFYKNTPLIKYTASLMKGDTVTFEQIDGMTLFEMKT